MKRLIAALLFVALTLVAASVSWGWEKSIDTPRGTLQLEHNSPTDVTWESVTWE